MARNSSTYRGARRNEARRRNLIWRELDRTIGEAKKGQLRVAGAALMQGTVCELKNSKKPHYGKRGATATVFGGVRFGIVRVVLPAA